MAKDRKEYEVGYGKPPKQHRFQKGKSGNPKGRAKGRKNLRAHFYDVLSKFVHITIDGRKIRVSARQAIAYLVLKSAMSGEQRSILLLANIDDAFNPPAEGMSNDEWPLNDTAFLVELLEKELIRLRKQKRGDE